MARSPGRIAAGFWTSFCAGALSACGAQSLNAGLRLDGVDGGASAESPDGPVAVAPGREDGAGGGGSCSNVSPCGGDVVGSWTVISSCLAVAGEVALSSLGLGCPSASLTGTRRVSGAWTANANGTYADQTTITGEEALSVPATCLEISGTPIGCDLVATALQNGLGYASIACSVVVSGGCSCAATIQASGLARVGAEPSTRGSHATSGDEITLNGDARYAYCVSTDTMTWTPRTGSPTITGTLTFQRVGTGGSGGASGTGGANGTGGASGTGGARGTGGVRGTGGNGESDGAVGSDGNGDANSEGKLPCDLYADDGGPCVAAHSTVRALSARYAGPLYQVRRSDGELRDIPLLSPGGFADANVQDDFCLDSSCTISIIYDQSGLGNHLTRAPAGMAKATPGKEADAMAVPVTFSGHKVYGLHVAPGVGYRNNAAVGTATGDEPETIYMVADGKYYNAGCCFDYGNVETDSRNNGEGAAEAVYFGAFDLWGSGAGRGPWVMGDLENGLWAGNLRVNPDNPSVTYSYVTAMVKGGPANANRWMIRVGDAQAGPLTTPFDGPRPSDRYHPMRKEGAIVLGTAGDNSNAGQANFFEGLMTAHFSSDAADQAVQASIVAAYGR